MARRQSSWHAAACSAFIAHGVAPLSGTIRRTISLFKHPKPGTPAPDPADPNSYRFLTMMNTLPKVLSLVITRRITHWATREGLVGPEQAGFVPQQACAQQVWTLRD